jgi:hypothetical protein
MVRKQRAFTKRKAFAVAEVAATELALLAAQKNVTTIEAELNELQGPTVVQLSTVPGPGKKGICFNDVSLSQQFTPSVAWAYNWDQTRPADLPAQVAFVPML